jgi:hypothetical protein
MTDYRALLARLQRQKDQLEDALPQMYNKCVNLKISKRAYPDMNSHVNSKVRIIHANTTRLEGSLM